VVNSHHGGSRTGAGRKPAPDPVFIKKFRASEAERKEFMALLTRDAREDFILVLHSLRSTRSLTKRAPDLGQAVANPGDEGVAPSG
jgi:hypothetical protein